MEHKRDFMLHLGKDQDMIIMIRMIMIVMMMMMMMTMMIVMMMTIIIVMIMMIVMMYGVETLFPTFASCMPAMLL